MSLYKFKLGQTVGLISSRREPALRGRFEIVRLLPEAAGSNQYRVRSKEDGHERVVVENQIT
jgi:hypothetical protein